VNAAACRAFDDGIRQLTELNAGARTPIAVGVAAETAHGKVTTASQMAAGPTAAEMTRAAAAIKLLQDKQKDFLQDGFTDEQEVSAVRAAVTGVARVCAGSGVTLQNRG
jgi:phage tail sheath gpL-like